MMHLACDNLSLGYGGMILIRSLTFSLNAGDYLCVVGENGAGKSTLIKSMLGLVAPISGKITAVKGTGYLPQQTEAQRDFPASVREVVLSGCQGRLNWRPFYSRKDKQDAEDAMKMMNVQDLRTRCYRELSGGQQQRVLLARALCAAKNMLVLDEPVSGLDPQAASEMYNLINDLNRNKHITVIMITHDVKEALKYATHVLHIKKDNVFFGTREEFARHD